MGSINRTPTEDTKKAYENIQKLLESHFEDISSKDGLVTRQIGNYEVTASRINGLIYLEPPVEIHSNLSGTSMVINAEQLDKNLSNRKFYDSVSGVFKKVEDILLKAGPVYVINRALTKSNPLINGIMAVSITVALLVAYNSNIMKSVENANSNEIAQIYKKYNIDKNYDQVSESKLEQISDNSASDRILVGNLETLNNTKIGNDLKLSLQSLDFTQSKIISKNGIPVDELKAKAITKLIQEEVLFLEKNNKFVDPLLSSKNIENGVYKYEVIKQMEEKYEIGLN
jgi:hypothetical protein